LRLGERGAADRTGGPGGSRPRRTVRLRLTIMYSVLFLLCGAVLLATTYVLMSRFAHAAAGPILLGKGSLPPAGRLLEPAGLTAGQAAAVQRLAHDRVFAQYATDMRDLLMWSLVALGIMLVVSVALGWVMAGRVLAPLRAITAAAKGISASSLHERLSLGGPADELRELGDTFDALLTRLEASFESQRRFVANASHELRTPLTYIRTAAGIAIRKREPPPSPQVIDLAGRVTQGLDQVDRILDGFLLLARAEHGAAQAERAMVSLRGLADAALAAQAAEMTAKRLDVRFDGAADAFTVGNTTLLSRLAENIIGNAIRHNERSGWIRLRITADGPVAILMVENGGRVLDEREVQSLAQPFRRLGAERTGSGGGAGLGLSIVAAIAAAHGGSLALHARPGGGLHVAVELPRAPGPATAGTTR
jgi:signal transduction histidine kinase